MQVILVSDLDTFFVVMVASISFDRQNWWSYYRRRWNLCDEKNLILGYESINDFINARFKCI